MSKETRYFTKEELESLGLRGDTHPEEDWEIPVDLQNTVDSHGTAYDIVFQCDGAFWRITVGYHHEGWLWCNDLQDCCGHDAVRVYPKQVTTTIYTTEPE